MSDITKSAISNASSKKKGIIIGISIFVALVVSFSLLYNLKLKPNYKIAIASYFESVVEYNDSYASYSEKCERFNNENAKLQNLIDSLQEIISSKEKPYDETTITKANSAINDGKIAMLELSVIEKIEIKDAEEYSPLQTGKIKSDEQIIKAKTDELSSATDTLNIPDYSKESKEIKNAQNDLENSIAQMKQITCPKESFVLKRIKRIRDKAGMVDVVALTEDTDPENYIGKAGWYTSKIIFRHKDVHHYGLESGLFTVSEIGNPSGGCIEVYKTENDANRRNDYLTSIEGTLKSPGAHIVLGTMVIRASEDLKASVQNKLLKMISDEMLRLDNPKE